MSTTHKGLSNFIWQVADLLRGPYRKPQYERVMLPMTVLRRFDCVLEPTKEMVVRKAKELERRDAPEEERDTILKDVAEQPFYNTSELTFEKLKGAPDELNFNLTSYIKGFSPNIRDIFQHFEFAEEIEKMHESNVLFMIVSKFCDIDLHPSRVDNIEMGLLFEDLIRRFNEAANETAGDHFTPREVIQLMVDLLFSPDEEILSQPHFIAEMLDPACGTGGMLSEAQNALREMNESAKLFVHGQDFNPRAYAIAASDLLMKGAKRGEVKLGDSLINDQFPDKEFDYFLANPPFGVDWKKQRSEIEQEHEEQGHAGRFGAGTPRVNDGSFLFLQHMLSKFQPYDPTDDDQRGSRLAIVFSGSPLFTGVAGSSESNIRQWIIENDWLEAIVALPEQMFYNTGIGTYVWVLSNRKPDERTGKIQLIDGRDLWEPLDRSLGDKRRRLGEGDIKHIVETYGALDESDISKVFDNEDFGFTRVYVERPLRLRVQITDERVSEYADAFPQHIQDVFAIREELGEEAYMDWNAVWAQCEAILDERGSKWLKKARTTFRDVMSDVDEDAAPVIDKKRKLKKGEHVTDAERHEGWFEHEAGSFGLGFTERFKVTYESNTDLKDYEYVPLKQDVDAFFREEVMPYVEDAWMDRSKDKIGYEINFTRHFYDYEPPRDLEDIDAELTTLENKIADLLQEVTA